MRTSWTSSPSMLATPSFLCGNCYQWATESNVWQALTPLEVLDRFLVAEPRDRRAARQLGHDLPCRLDYLAISDDLATAYFIELKTDPKSKDKTQFANMAAAKKAGFRSIMRGLLKVVEASEEKHKYCCLLRLLAQHGLITLPDSLAQALQSRHYRTAVNACLPMIALAEIDPEVKLIYVEPIATTSDDIGFVEFAGWLDKLKDDDLAQRLSLSLKRWVASPAGR